MRMRLSIGQLASRTGESVKTLRYWTDFGLLATERGENGYRYYQPGMAERAAFIRSAQALGFTLAEIGEILSLRETGLQPCTEVREQLAAHLDGVKRRIAVLRNLEGELEARLQWAAAHPDPQCERDGCVYLVDDGVNRGATTQRRGSCHPATERPRDDLAFRRVLAPLEPSC
jgi:DNA-binding transcriptional MerR regulator